MKKIITLILVLTTIGVTAQEKVKTQKVKNPKTVKTASGLEYTITEKGNGKKPQNGDKVKVHYTGKLTNDTVFDSSVGRGQPFEFKLGAGQVIKGWDEAFLLLQVGDKATIKFGPELGYGDRATGKIPANSTLIFDVELLDVIEGIKPYDVKGKDTVKTASGLQLITVQANKSGEQAVKGTKVVAQYSAFLTDGKMFDSSIERGQPLKANIGKGQLFAGLEEGLSLMRKGEKARMIIPSKLAFGEKGNGPIPANADIIFDIELVDVQKVVAPVLFDIKGLEAKKTASGLTYYEVKRSGSPVKAAAGKTVKVHYSGYLADGTMFDSSVERGEPLEFPLGQAMVIQGWEEGIALMSVGDKLRLVIPYMLAYGEAGRPPMIPAKADLTFDVELVDVKDASPQH
ncbi:MAG: putative FKBP-type peptidyl-prolyl cis-trans isomerase [Bacteroidota bacterium]|jgi:FKBP-type peptidyl-prolyl cis-trans isomerase|nr:putative FKBP-type peptidyl-prolyl cis-trans isomerase [Bacteroidota bacterium]